MQPHGFCPVMTGGVCRSGRERSETGRGKLRLGRGQRSIASLGKSLLVGGKHLKGPFPIACMIIDVNGSGTSPPHDQATERFTFPLIRLSIKMSCSLSTGGSQRDEKLANEQVPNVMR